MKAAVARKPLIRVAVVESDPLRFVGFRALFDSEPDLELVSASLPELGQLPNVDLILLGNRGGHNLFDIMASLKAVRPDLRILVTGSGMDEESILKAIAAGAKGYVDEAASPTEFVQALRVVNQGSVWAPRRVLSTFIERVTASPGRIFPAGRVTFTDREKEVLEMLVAIGDPPTEQQHLEQLANLDQRLGGVLAQDADAKLARALILVSYRLLAQLAEVLDLELRAIVQPVESLDDVRYRPIPQLDEAERRNLDTDQLGQPHGQVFVLGDKGESRRFGLQDIPATSRCNLKTRLVDRKP